MKSSATWQSKWSHSCVPCVAQINRRLVPEGRGKKTHLGQNKRLIASQDQMVSIILFIYFQAFSFMDGKQTAALFDLCSLSLMAILEKSKKKKQLFLVHRDLRQLCILFRTVMSRSLYLPTAIVHPQILQHIQYSVSLHSSTTFPSISPRHLFDIPITNPFSPSSSALKVPATLLHLLQISPWHISTRQFIIFSFSFSFALIVFNFMFPGPDNYLPACLPTPVCAPSCYFCKITAFAPVQPCEGSSQFGFCSNNNHRFLKNVWSSLCCYFDGACFHTISQVFEEILLLSCRDIWLLTTVCTRERCLRIQCRRDEKFVRLIHIKVLSEVETAIEYLSTRIITFVSHIEPIVTTIFLNWMSKVFYA